MLAVAVLIVAVADARRARRTDADADADDDADANDDGVGGDGRWVHSVLVEQVVVSALVLTASLLLLASRPTRGRLRAALGRLVLGRKKSDTGAAHQQVAMNEAEREAREFERNWPDVRDGPYGGLVLPPTCRRVRASSSSTKFVGARVKAGRIVRYDYVGAVRIVASQTCRLVRAAPSFLLGRVLGRVLPRWNGRPATPAPEAVAAGTGHDDDDDSTVATIVSAASGTTDDGGHDHHSHEVQDPRSPIHLVRSSSFSSCSSGTTRRERSSSECSSCDAATAGPAGPGREAGPHYQPHQQHASSRHRTMGKEKDALASYRKRVSTQLLSPPKKAAGSSHHPPAVERPQPPAPARAAPSMAHAHAQAQAHPPPPPPMPQQHARQRSEHLNFFDAPNSDAAMKRLSREVPVPDRNGYVLCPWSEESTPVLAFVNSTSGLQQGHFLITQLRRLLNPIQVWDLADGGPEKILESFCAALPRLRLLVCGGDGTVSWIISAVSKMENLERWPPIAILPLGTGNDLARVHGWGGGYNNESLILILRQTSEAFVSVLDQWELAIESNNRKRARKCKSFTNYLGVGVDAQAALQVHTLRETKPTLFFSRAFNKVWYLFAGAEEALEASCAGLPEQVVLVADGVEVPLPPDSQGIIFLNIDSYAGGVPLWSNGHRARPTLGRSSSVDDFFVGGRTPRAGGHRLDGTVSLRRRGGSSFRQRRDRNDSVDYSVDYEFNNLLTEEEKRLQVTSCDLPSSSQDGLLDVVSVRGTFHLGQIRVGLSGAQRLCQCSEAQITLKKKMAVQIDGEPWRQSSGTLTIKKKKEAVSLLQRSSDDGGGVEMEMSKLLDWAEERNIIDRSGHAILMKEFSRRMASSNSQRRVGSQENLMRSLRRAIVSNGA